MAIEQNVIVAVVATSLVAATGLSDPAVAVFGVPMATVLAAFAGSMISLTFLPGQGFGRALGTVASGTVAGAYLAPFVLQMPGLLFSGLENLPAALDKPVAFLLGLGFQIAVPAFYNWIRTRGKKEGA